MIESMKGKKLNTQEQSEEVQLFDIVQDLSKINSGFKKYGIQVAAPGGKALVFLLHDDTYDGNLFYATDELGMKQGNFSYSAESGLYTMVSGSATDWGEKYLPKKFKLHEGE